MKKKEKTFWVARDGYGGVFEYSHEPVWIERTRVFYRKAFPSSHVESWRIKCFGIKLKPGQKKKFKLVEVKES